MISTKLLSELHEIFQKDYGVDLKKEQVEELANTLLRFFETLLSVSNCNNEE